MIRPVAGVCLLPGQGDFIMGFLHYGGIFMNLTVNGKALSIEKSINLKELLTSPTM